MDNSQRAEKYAGLLNAAGKHWRHVVPVDGEIARLTADGAPRVRISGHVIAQDLTGEWRVTPRRTPDADDHKSGN